ncbi:protein phosphatase 2C domain-containing protein [Rhizobium ruizarguesonis]|uniref:protein phosphatase 2C domain-containing protein n=1 Tax=Rhizobium ruizarguesonis TaxID=2081791 RepID=UPI0010306AFC|nr:protein phosphatase 2C domain-containing protein [Rhizobium ruizarguesonis]TBA31334.1 hypothetical protein ELH63_35360 [Rhizobium ruizarguesonis]TBA31388.1 hypothetical protein ELH62_32730 [Rhizobium ruizarguesonis]
MKIEALWFSQQGTRTTDNRDHAGIGTRDGEFLAIVADGSTAGPMNGEYARSIVEMVVDWFVGAADPFSNEHVLKALKQIHQTLRETFPRGSASILLFHVSERADLTVIHSGDCVLGWIDADIVWQTSPHTLANALAAMPLKDIAKSAIRHRLTQSFRAKEYMPPEILTQEQVAGIFLLATDGFWAELTEPEQIAFLGGDQSATAERDDRSVLELLISPNDALEVSLNNRSSSNLYRKS